MDWHTGNTPSLSGSLVQLRLNTEEAVWTSTWHAAQSAFRTLTCKLPLASPQTLAAPVVTEQQPLQRQGQGRWTAASGVLPIWRLMMLLLLLTLRTPELCLARILNSAVASCLGA